MNQREKEQYLREYAILKGQGKPFFPYAVAKDAVMACVVMAVIITLSLVLGAELGSKANPVRENMPKGEYDYLHRLRCPDGQAPAANRVGNVGTGVYGNIVDLFRVACAGAATVEIYMDMYHDGPELRPVPGFTIAPVRKSGRPTPTTTISASCVRRSRATVRRCAIDTVAFSASRRYAAGRPITVLRPMITACAPSSGTS